MSKAISASLIATTLFAGVGVQAAHADTITTTTTTTKTVVTTTVVKDTPVKNGEGTIVAGTKTTTTKPVTTAKPAATTTPAPTKVVEPYYNYTGYTARNVDFALDKYFVQSLNYGNFKLNDITVSKTPVTKGKATSTLVNDTKVTKMNNAVSSITVPVKNGLVKKADFLKAHAGNTLVKDTTAKSGVSTVKYSTKTGSYTATFDKAGFLTTIKVNAVVK